MLTKILFTVLVVVGVISAARFRARQIQAQPPPAADAMPAAATWLPKAFGIAVAALILAGTGTYYYLGWRDDHRIVSIRVINTSTGEEATYRAHKGDISGRSFQTLEGWSVTVSDGERVEMVQE